ncbi:MAG: GPW/gp25 family protein [bacterium]
MVSYNIKFPIEDDGVKNRFLQTTTTTKKALGSNLLLLLLTQKGERYYMPDYGTNLLKFIFEPNDGDTIEDIKEDLKRTVATYIPQLTIDRVLFDRNEDGDGNPIGENELSIKISFTYKEDTFSETGEIELNF